MLTIQALPSAGLVHHQLFIPQAVPRVAPVAPQGFKTSNKRTRSPSPPPAVPVSLYHQGYAYKPQAVPNTSYQPPPPQSKYCLNIKLFFQLFSSSSFLGLKIHSRTKTSLLI